jgi:enoyl-CoA hydratase
MTELVSYRLEDSVAVVAMDDGKLNVLSRQMLEELDGALDRAAADRAVVVITGRPGAFSAGFDLKELRAGGDESVALLRAGFELAERLLSFPLPVVIACSGHAMAMGVFLLLSADYRVGVAGPFKISANEVAIGMTIPRAAVEICRQRLVPAHFSRAVLLAELYSPDTALDAGFLDRVVAAAELPAAAKEVAAALTKLDMQAHAASKLRARAQMLEALRYAIEADQADFRARLSGADAR